MKKQIEEMYIKQKNRQVKAMVMGVLVLFVMMGIVSIFLGNPFPHKEKLLLLEITSHGWIITNGYLLGLCGVAGVLVSLGNMMWGILHEFSKLDRILLQECDAERYLELMEYAVAYGRGLQWRGLQKTVLLLAEQKYVMALIANQKFREAEFYLKEEWIGKRNSRLFRLVSTNLKLAESYEMQETECFCKVLQSTGNEFAKNRLFTAKGFLLKKDYEAALEVLTGYEEKRLYYEVGRQFLLGNCYDKLGHKSHATACMKYVAEHGNTMPHKARAKEWLAQNPLLLIEQKEE